MRLLFITLAILLTYFTPLSAQWTQCNGITGGGVRVLATSGNTIFAGSRGGGVFRSTDNGESWKAVNNGLTNQDVRSLVVTGTTVFAGTWTSGVFRSTNNGETWKEMNSGLTEKSVNTLFLHDNYVYVGTYGGLYRCPLGYDGWSADTNGLMNRVVYCIAVANNTLIIGTKSGVFRKFNDYVWKPISNGLAHVISLSVSGQTVFAGTYDKIFRSPDNGNSWLAVDDTLIKGIYSFGFNGETIFAAGTLYNGVFRSTDNGISWKPFSNGLTNVYVSCFTLSGDSTAILIGTSDGVFLSSDNGESWKAVNNRLMNHYINSLVSNDSTVFAGTNRGIYRSTDNGETWGNSGLSNYVVNSLTLNGTTVFTGIQYGGVLRSTDNGKTWDTVNTGLTNKYVTSLASNGTTVFAGTLGGGGVFRSTNNGKSWEALKIDFGDNDVYTVAAVGTTVFAGARVLYRSTDNGETWRSTGLNDVISSLAPNDTMLFVGTERYGVYRGSHTGRRWTAITEGIMSKIQSLTVSGTMIFASTRGYYVTSDGRLFCSTNNGDTWVDINDGLMNSTTSSITINGTTVFAGTTGNSVFKAELKDLITSVDDTPPQPTSNTWCYPNPTTDVLTMSIPSSMANSSGVIRYSIINLRGEELLSIESESATASIPTNGIPSGTYTVVVTRGTQRTAAMVSVVR